MNLRTKTLLTIGIAVLILVLVVISSFFINSKDILTNFSIMNQAPSLPAQNIIADFLAAQSEGGFFFYLLDELKSHLARLVQLAGEDICLWYACKANPLPEIIKLAYASGFNLDIASRGEFSRAINCGVDPSRMIATGPAKSAAYLDQFLNAGVSTIVLESLNQAALVAAWGRAHHQRPQVLLRLQLPWDGGNSVLGGQNLTPFGLPPKDWESFNPAWHQDLAVIGVQNFQWGNINDAQRLAYIWQTAAIAAQRLSEKLNFKLQVLDIGGGLGLDYQSFSLRPMLDFGQVKQILHQLCQDFKIKVWMELGRYAVGPYGIYTAQVIDRKTAAASEILVLSGGINHLARPALTQEAFPGGMVRSSTALRKKFQVHGPLCTALDRLGEYNLPEDIHPGDWLYFMQAGAYGMTEAMPFFLCHPLAQEVSIENNTAQLLPAHF